MKNDGKEFELVTREIFQQLADQDNVPNIAVKHNKLLNGKFCTHQIDVYWKFKLGDTVYETVVECKDWENSDVQQNALFAFRAILEDLNNPKGIFVARKGFQKGARQYAKAHGIILYSLKEEPEHSPIEIKEGSLAEMKLRPEDVMAEVTIYETTAQKIKLFVDPDWFAAIQEQLGEDILKGFQTKTNPRNTIFADEQDQKIGDLLEYIRPVAEEIYKTKNSGRRTITKEFDSPTYLRSGVEEVPLIKLDGIRYDVVVDKKPPFESPMKLKGFAGFILKNILEKKSKRYLVKRDRKV